MAISFTHFAPFELPHAIQVPFCPSPAALCRRSSSPNWGSSESFSSFHRPLVYNPEDFDGRDKVMVRTRKMTEYFNDVVRHFSVSPVYDEEEDEEIVAPSSDSRNEHSQEQSASASPFGVFRLGDSFSLRALSLI
ncbi:unnamed protein product [Linum tenue]|uniref:Uncharacterized protein n=1 Tax=Linum tenue TaxID=586396 RepID=A0AAV0IPP3_9ROSI|nr:unnamed protein product [Linum tenue]